MAVQPVPEGYHTVTPVLIADDADGLLSFVKAAFGATENDVIRRPDGVIVHADVTIGDSHVMLSQGNDQFPPTRSAVYLYVPDAAEVYRKTLAAGATSVRAPEKQFYGDLNATVSAYGVLWSIGSRVEAVPPEEMERRTKAYLATSARE